MERIDAGSVETLVYSSAPAASVTHRRVFARSRLLTLVRRGRAASIHAAHRTRRGTSLDGARRGGTGSIGTTRVAVRTLLHQGAEGRVRHAAQVRTEIGSERRAVEGNPCGEETREDERTRGESRASISLSASSRSTPNRSGVRTRVVRETVVERGFAVAVGTNDRRAVARKERTVVRVLRVSASRQSCLHTLAGDATVGERRGTSVGSRAVLDGRHTLVVPAANRLAYVGVEQKRDCRHRNRDADGTARDARRTDRWDI